VDRSLSQAELVENLDRWVGAEVAVRVVSGEELIAVFRGRLGERVADRNPTLFWPLGELAHGLELSGVFLHPEKFQGAAAHEGMFVIELRQGGVTLNIRRTEAERRLTPG